AWEALANYYNARPSTSGVCPHTVEGQAHSAAGWAGGRQSAARWSTRSCGAHVGKRFRRRQRRAGHRSEGRHHRHRGFLVIRRARAGLSKSGQVSHRACAQCRHSGTDVRVNTRNRVLATPTGACHAVCAPSFSSWASFHYNLFTAVRKSTCHDGISVRCHAAWDSVASWGKCEVSCVISIHQ
ncbi:mucin-associated surface protein (MASP), partial [Trypanosoma cruzi]